MFIDQRPSRANKHGYIRRDDNFLTPSEFSFKPAFYQQIVLYKNDEIV